MKSIIHESDLYEFSVCPLRTAGGTSYSKNELSTRSHGALSSLILQAFEGPEPSSHDIQKALDNIKEFNLLKPAKASREDLVYEAKLKTGKLLSGLFSSYSVLQPVVRYRLKIDVKQIEGEYAVLRHKKPGSNPVILRIRHRGTPDGTAPIRVWPNDIINYLRFAHFMSENEVPTVSILNLHIPSGQFWLNDNLMLTPVLSGIRNLVTAYTLGGNYPVPGAACSTCKTQACLGVAR